MPRTQHEVLSNNYKIIFTMFKNLLKIFEENKSFKPNDKEASAYAAFKSQLESEEEKIKLTDNELKLLNKKEKHVLPEDKKMFSVYQEPETQLILKTEENATSEFEIMIYDYKAFSNNLKLRTTTKLQNKIEKILDQMHALPIKSRLRSMNE